MDKKIVIAVDAMGGENSPKKVIEGINISIKRNKKNFFFLYGNKNLIDKYFDIHKDIKPYCEVIHSVDEISDEESPLVAAKKKSKTSMWKAINSQYENNADISLSAGNTGALLVVSRLLLSTIKGIDKPALAGLWPNKSGMNVVLDLGANIDCNDKNLIDFSKMGSALFKSLYPNTIAKVALLNIGSEEIKGKDNLKNALHYLKNEHNNDYEFSGYIEPNHIMDGNVNVIVTDGFTGNVALKTAEGTANFITKSLKESFSKSLLAKISMFVSRKSLNDFRDKLDPRKYNGAILLGLEGPVVKSHGSIDALGFSYSIEMCNKIIENNLIKKIKFNLNDSD